MFTHEKFEAYQLSIKFTELALRLIDELPSGHSALREQLNIAEGTGKSWES